MSNDQDPLKLLFPTDSEKHKRFWEMLTQDSDNSENSDLNKLNPVEE